MSSTVMVSDSEMSECQFHNNCGGWCETRRELEHNLCEHCLDAHDEEMAEPAEQTIRENAARYLWLRNHAVRIQGSDMWYQGAALDIRVDVGRDRMAEQAKSVQEGGVLLLRHQPD
ncbi:hypothetical protein [Pseudomonas putida]|uniref:hypothetical protein n=1 Tax=Pseudomonas putida TaxID=303 RepID=UPI00209C622A|nr:hypothetical protein [Pseudomonas putida]